MPRVLNKRTESAGDAVYIGRPSKWGNPFSHLDGTLAKHRVATRTEAINRYVEWLWSKDGLELFKQLGELRDKDLLCWCAPQQCHGHELELLANHDGKDCAKCGEAFEEDNERMSYYGMAICRSCLEEVLSDR